MNERRIFGMGALLGALVVMGIACRQNVPTDEPKTPPNSPIPEIDRKDQEPKAPPAPPARDAG